MLCKTGNRFQNQFIEQSYACHLIKCLKTQYSNSCNFWNSSVDQKLKKLRVNCKLDNLFKREMSVWKFFLKTCGIWPFSQLCQTCKDCLFDGPLNSSLNYVIFSIFLVRFFLPTTTMYLLGVVSRSTQWAAVTTQLGLSREPPQTCLL